MKGGRNGCIDPLSVQQTNISDRNQIRFPKKCSHEPKRRQRLAPQRGKYYYIIVCGALRPSIKKETPLLTRRREEVEKETNEDGKTKC